ncbi:hypothetical protein Echvi_0134 [Echinicola vietnamensis DSM 17526]|uniref:Uncharacterized protein n=1 Tax=Echinicola vietnamensis (strain DSM 17526 / LMG 23754 / KMM 6221) TaxID=926556 RepID=L0FUJ5_ECHVK|nr:hypothetical protein Echvi_0134 [Echinicola vietnamensis DSM 17526]
MISPKETKSKLTGISIENRSPVVKRMLVTGYFCSNLKTSRSKSGEAAKMGLVYFDGYAYALPSLAALWSRMNTDIHRCGLEALLICVHPFYPWLKIRLMVTMDLPFAMQRGPAKAWSMLLIDHAIKEAACQEYRVDHYFRFFLPFLSSSGTIGLKMSSASIFWALLSMMMS